jgi:hypothetical protein
MVLNFNFIQLGERRQVIETKLYSDIGAKRDLNVMKIGWLIE